MRIPIFCVLVLILSACKKEKSLKWTENDIYVTNVTTGEPINNLSISVLEEKIKTLNSMYAKYDGETDDNGFCQINFKRKRNATYQLGLNVIEDYNGTKYYAYQPDTFLYDINQFGENELEDKNEFHVKIGVYGYVKFEKTNPICDSSDHIYGSISYKGPLEPPGESAFIFQIYGYAFQSLFHTYKLLPGEHHLSYTLGSSETLEPTDTTFIVHEADTTVISITF